MKKVTYTEMSDREFDELVEATYGHKYEFAPDVECGNDSSPRFSVKKGEITSDWDKNELAKFIETGECSYFAHMLFNDLCDRGVLEPGNYLVNVSW